MAATTKSKEIAVTNNFEVTAICNTAIENVGGENVMQMVVFLLIMKLQTKQSSAMIFSQKR